MADYDETGWTGSTWLNPGDASGPATGARAAE
jgi:hypothetical protein